MNSTYIMTPKAHQAIETARVILMVTHLLCGNERYFLCSPCHCGECGACMGCSLGLTASHKLLHR